MTSATRLKSSTWKLTLMPSSPSCRLKMWNQANSFNLLHGLAVARKFRLVTHRIVITAF